MDVVVECGEHIGHRNVCDLDLDDCVQSPSSVFVARRPPRVMRIKIMKLKVTVLAA